MARSRQLWLPRLKVERLVVKKNPQPHVEKLDCPKKFELLHHPFDLKFRGRVNKWISQLFAAKNKKLKKLIDAESVKVIKLYFYPQGSEKKWLNQDEILKRTGIAYKKKLRSKLVACLIEVWSEARV